LNGNLEGGTKTPFSNAMKSRIIETIDFLNFNKNYFLSFPPYVPYSIHTLKYITTSHTTQKIYDVREEVFDTSLSVKTYYNISI